VEVDPLLANRKIADENRLGHGVEAVREIEVDERALSILEFIESGSLLKLAAQVSEPIVPPNLLETQRRSFLLVPAIVEVKLARVPAPVLFSFGRRGLLVVAALSFAAVASSFTLSSSAAGTNTGICVSLSFPAASPGVMNTLESKWGSPSPETS